MIQLTYDNLNQRGDLVRDGANLVDAYDLETAVLISIFTERRLETGDEADPHATTKGGWWGDTYAGSRIGSRLWLLKRSVATPSALARAKTYIEEALRWMIDDGVAASVVVTAGRGETPHMLRFTVDITRPAGQSRWSRAWEVQFSGL